MTQYPQGTQIAKDVEESLKGAHMAADFNMEVFLSSDGKHTVHVSSGTPEGRIAAVAEAIEVFDDLLARYGTKQAQAVKEYKKADYTAGANFPEDKTSSSMCPVHRKPFVDGKWGMYCPHKNTDGTWCKQKPQ